MDQKALSLQVPMPSVVAVITWANAVLVSKRAKGCFREGMIQFPGGAFDHGESIESATLREVAEETGSRSRPTTSQASSMSTAKLAQKATARVIGSVYSSTSSSKRTTCRTSQ